MTEGRRFRLASLAGRSGLSADGGPSCVVNGTTPASFRSFFEFMAGNILNFFGRATVNVGEQGPPQRPAPAPEAREERAPVAQAPEAGPDRAIETVNDAMDIDEVPRANPVGERENGSVVNPPNGPGPGPSRRRWPLLSIIILILLAAPIGNSELERSFSLVKRTSLDPHRQNASPENKSAMNRAHVNKDLNLYSIEPSA